MKCFNRILSDSSISITFEKRDECHFLFNCLCMKNAEMKNPSPLPDISTFGRNNIFVFLNQSKCIFLCCYCNLKVSFLHTLGPQYFGGVGSGLSKVYRSINIPLSDLDLEQLLSPLKGRMAPFCCHICHGLISLFFV